MLTRAPSASTVEAQPPDGFPGFDEQRRDAGPREVRRADESVVAHADHDRAVVHRASYDASDESSSPGRPPRAAGGRADRARLDPDPTARRDRTARPPPAVLDRPGDRRRGRRGRRARARRRARSVAAPAARVHEVERARVVRGHGLAVGDDVARGARRHRPVAGDAAGQASRLPQRSRRQLVVAERRLSRAAAEVRAHDVPRPSLRAARPRRQGRDRSRRRAGDGRARRHRRDLADAAPAARARRPRTPGSATSPTTSPTTDTSASAARSASGGCRTTSGRAVTSAIPRASTAERGKALFEAAVAAVGPSLVEVRAFTLPRG